MKLTTIFFDLDDTLYPASSGLWPIIRNRIGAYMVERLGIPEKEMPFIRKQLFEEYGTTLRGLQLTCQVDVPDFLAYVHDVNLSEYIQPDPVLKAVLDKVEARKLIFTNADKNHARRVLKVLQLENYFEDIIDVVALNPYCKPMAPAFDFALKSTGETDPSCCVMIDDISRTTRAAREFGMFSLLFGSKIQNGDADVSFSDWSDLPGILDRRINAS